jgi:Domain of unknown function (DUF4160)
MPIISIFYGITVSMYFGDHPPPHIHVEYQGHEALVRISDAEVIRGRLPAVARRLVRQWTALHRNALKANFDRVQDYKRPEQIPGLDDDAD